MADHAQVRRHAGQERGLIRASVAAVASVATFAIFASVVSVMSVESAFAPALR